MLRRLSQLLGLGSTDNNSRRNKQLEGSIRSSTYDLSIQLEDITVRIVHAGGREERYQRPVAASRLIDKYPGMCVARPQVFKQPHESVLSADEKLLPGNKYYIIPCTTVQKLKRKHSLKGSANETSEYNERLLKEKRVTSVEEQDISEDSVCSAKDFFQSDDRQSRFLRSKSQKSKKSFVPPIQKPKLLRSLTWEPSLISIEELST